MDISGYKHDYEGFCENFTYPISINKGKTTKTEGIHRNFVGNSLFSLLVKSFEAEIQLFDDCVDYVGG